MVSLGKSKSGQIIIASLIQGRLLGNELRGNGPIKDEDTIKKWVMEFLFALDHLHDLGIVVGNLSKDNVYVCGTDICLLNYALYFITGQGVDVDFVIGSKPYLAPEASQAELEDDAIPIPYTFKGDTWALGILLLELAVGPLDSDISMEDILDHIHHFPSHFSIEFKLFLTMCLTLDPIQRPSIASLFNHPFLLELKRPVTWHKRPYIAPISQDIHTLNHFHPTKLELFHFWNLAGGDLTREVPELTSKKPIILSIPSWVSRISNVEELVLSLQERPAFSSEARLIPLSNLLERIRSLKLSLNLGRSILDRYNDQWKYHPLFGQITIEESWSLFNSKHLTQLNSRNKESDMEYQLIRLFRFRSLLAGFPATLESIKIEAIADIPPVLLFSNLATKRANMGSRAKRSRRT
jgi:serine/threonine protein kinase